MATPVKKRTIALPGLAALVAALVLSACGSGEATSDDPGNAADAPSFEAALDRAPPPLADLYADGGQVFDGSADAFEAKLADVKGYPAVVNVWASWCAPCRAEVPYLQDAAAKYLDQVAFMGIDVSDTDAAAETYLRDHPQPYPSLTDPDYEWALDVESTLVGQPNTIFFDRDGKTVHVEYGPYASAEDLEADVRKYALSG